MVVGRLDDVLTFLTALRLQAIDTELLITMTIGPVSERKREGGGARRHE
jgi:hypothetical protein